MKIIVCIKQVPDPDNNDTKFNRETNTLNRAGVNGVINPFDLYAIEEGLRLKEMYGGEVTAISMGPSQVTEALREAVAMGVDNAVLLSDKAFAGADTLATAYTLAKGIEKLGPFDLITCGKQAIDGDTAQVGPGLAENLGIPHVTCVRKIKSLVNGKMILERMTETGAERVRLPLPALITVVKELNEPRFPSLKGKMRAKKIEIPSWSAQGIAADESKIGLKGSPTRVQKIFIPRYSTGGEILEGTLPEQIEVLITKLRESKILYEDR